ncbi:peptidase S8/S53 domain-containing protein [Plectosphaerella plurivora]|uniref:Peptidase S8/S53 domain-containing protein n=1 Tax=Plectosphaerella plurivora TaxID=936078 RepID=A0A9P8VBB1_9PEZI|nr:peptidase S8/S53 domain-containing protein [Plectosphaerella plurivora]
MQRLIPGTDDDRDYQTQRRTNLRRLQRVIDDEWIEWENEHKLRFCEIALACLDFKTHVEEFEHAEDEPCLQYLTILHRSIIEPLYKELARCSQGLKLFPSGYDSTEQPSSILLYDNGEADGQGVKAKWAQEAMNQWDDNFVEYVRKARDNLSMTAVPCNRVLVAILDTGIDLEDKAIKRDHRSGRFKGKMNWTDKSRPDDISDNHGHSTHVARLVLSMAPCADILVAKVSNELTIPKNKLSGIAEAINWAIDEGANIISMSLGYENYNRAIEAAVSRAYTQGILMVAAASNQGGNAKKGKGRTRPASSHKVICIHACDGKGNEGGMSPNPKPKTENFSMLGVAIPSKWKSNIVHKSGTSFATPVAAALAANVLEFASFHLASAQMTGLREKEAMSQVFLDMSEERTDYDHVWPCRWDWSNTGEVIKNIMDALG